MEPDGTESSQLGAISGQHLNKACEPCRTSKLRCIASDEPQDDSCKRCLATGRSCVFKAPRARQRRKIHVDTRVAMLERQLRSLKMQLDLAQRWNEGKDVNVTEYASADAKSHSKRGPLRFEAPVTPASWPKKTATSTSKPSPPLTRGPFIAEDDPAQDSDEGIGFTTYDVVTREVVTWPAAEHLVHLYFSEFAPRYPFVTLPSYSNAEHLRLHRPATFLAIITAASVISTPEENAALTKELLTLVARRAVLEGEHTLDLAQAMIVLTIWYSTLERFHSLRHYQLAHLAATIATDLDSEWNDEGRGGDRFSNDDLEYLQTILSIYLLCSGTSITSGRPKMLQFTDSYIAENLNLLESRRSGKDRWFIAWVRLQHLAEKAVDTFCSGHEPFDISQIHNQLLVVEHCQKLDLWRMGLGFELEGGLSIHYHYVRSVILCVCLYANHGLTNFRPPFYIQTIEANLPRAPPLTPFMARTFMALIETVHSGLDAFLSFDAWGLQLAPLIYYIRTIHPLTVLLTLDMAVRRPGNELAKIVEPNMLKVEHYLHAFKAMLPTATEHGKGNNPGKFLVIVERMEAWWQSQTQARLQSSDTPRMFTVLTDDRVVVAQRKGDIANRRQPYKPHQSTSPGTLVATDTVRSPEQQAPEVTNRTSGCDRDDLLADDWIFDIGQDASALFAPGIDWTYLDAQDKFS